MEIGRINKMPVMRVAEQGVLVGDRTHFVLLPPGEAPADVEKGDTLDVFVFIDRNGHPAGTIYKPYGQAGEFVMLEIVEVTEIGAFAYWGLGKDLLIPNNKQYSPLRSGQKALVAIQVDPKSGRMFGSTWIGQYLNHSPEGINRGDEVTFLTYGRNETGILGIVNKSYSGMIPFEEFTRRPDHGDELEVFVQRVLDEGKIDCTLRVPGEQGRDQNEAAVLAAIRAGGGRLLLTDRSSPAQVRGRLSMSKKAFKKAVGALYKRRVVRIEDDGIVLV